MNNSTTKPHLVLSSLDVERIETLLDSLPDNGFPGKEALEAELERADIVSPEAVPPNIVTMHSTVTFKEVSSGTQYAFTLSYPNDIQPTDTDKISILAPVGSALLGLAIGDEIAWQKPGGGLMQLYIEDIVYQPERMGELHR